jgi:hypothetical protein
MAQIDGNRRDINEDQEEFWKNIATPISVHSQFNYAFSVYIFLGVNVNNIWTCIVQLILNRKCELSVQ